MWKYYALLAALCAALTAIFSKIGVKDINPDLATAVRVSFILVLVWGICLLSGTVKGLASISLTGVFFLFLSALATGFSWLFYFRALNFGDVAKVAPIDKLSVPITMLLAWLFLGESLTLKTIIGGALITAGTILMLL